MRTDAGEGRRSSLVIIARCFDGQGIPRQGGGMTKRKPRFPFESLPDEVWRQSPYPSYEVSSQWWAHVR
jgi:hypothetical protein